MIKNIIILILILLLIGAIIFLDVPKVQEVLALRKQVKQEKEAFSEKETLLAKVEELSDDYEENKEELEKVDLILPSDQDIPNLIIQLEALVFENGLVLESINITSLEKESTGRAGEVRSSQAQISQKNYRILTVNLKLVGDYSGFKNFLGAVENNMRLMDIISFDLSSESAESGLSEFNVSLKTYYQ